MSRSSATLVSGFFSSSNVSHRKIEEYIEHGKKLINIPVNKVIFIEKQIYDMYLSSHIDKKILENTTFYFVEKGDMYLYEYYDKITNFNIFTDNKVKDTIDYMLIICNKTEWVKTVIEKNPYNSDQFIWVDFGIYHVILDDEIMVNSILSLMDKKYDEVRIAGGGFNENSITDENIYQNIVWCFLGGIFGGPGDKLTIFADLMREKCLSIIDEKKTIMWEVNIWYLIYKKHPELISIYVADHNPSMIEMY
jgi:hypothetical protein